MKVFGKSVSGIARCAFAMALGAAGYYAWSRHPVVFDDAYITFRYADNLASGHGAVYNPGERVEGYTNFAWMLLAAAGKWAGGDPLAVMRALGLASHVLMLALLGWFGARWLLASGWRGVPALALLGVLLAPKGFAAMAGSGLETSSAACLLVAIALQIRLGDFSHWRSRALLSALLVLALLTRLDAALAVGAAAVAIGYGELSAGLGVKTALRNVMLVMAPVIVVVAVWTLWRRAYYGDWLPNTFYAKAADQPHIEPGLAYLVSFARTQPQALPLLGAALMSLFSRDISVRRMGLFAVLTLFGGLAYMVSVGGDFMEFRFMWQLYGLLVVAALAGLASISPPSAAGLLAITICGLALLGTPVAGHDQYTLQSLDEMNAYERMGETVGRSLRAVLPRGTVISTTLAGTVAYFSKLPVIDQWGLNDRYVAHRESTHFLRGHVKFAPIEYLQSRKVNLYIDHPIICSCTSPCRQANPSVFVRLSDGSCLRTWYLTPTDQLTEYFCSHPAWFTLDHVRCRGAPNPPPAAAPKAAAAPAQKPAASKPPAKRPKS